MKYKKRKFPTKEERRRCIIGCYEQLIRDGKKDKDGYAMKRWSYLKENDYLVSS